MPGVDFDVLTDCILSVRPDAPKRTYQVVRTKHRYPGCDMWFRDNSYRKQIAAPSIERFAKLDAPQGNVKWASPYTTQQTNVRQSMKKTTADPTMMIGSWGVDSWEMINRMGNADVLADFIDSRRTEETTAAINELELAHWRCPQSADSLQAFRGYPYHISMAQSGVNDDEPSFNGYTVRYEDGSSSTTKAGQDGSSLTYHRNLTAQYSGTSVSASLIQSISAMLNLLTFQTIPIPGGTDAVNWDKQFGPMQACEIYSGFTVFNELEKYMRAHWDEWRNDLDGPGFGPGSISFRGIKWCWVDDLNDRSYNPIYLVPKYNYEYLYWSMDGSFLEDIEPLRDKDQPTVIVNPYTMRPQLHTTLIRECGGVIHNEI